MTTPTPSFMTVCRYLRRHAPGLRSGSTKGLAHCVAWYWRDARLGIVHAAGNIVAVALARCIDQIGQEKEPYFHNEAGRIVWVQDICSEHPLGITCLLQHAIARFGQRDTFAGHIFSRNGELRVLPFSTVQRLTTGVHAHGLTINSRTASRA
jgi:hypothetical protein